MLTRSRLALWLAVGILIWIVILTLAACEPTGSPRCDEHVAPWSGIEEKGYVLNCNPDFTPDKPIHGWTDHKQKTVWVWPDRVTGVREKDRLEKLLWHELAHVRGISDEWLADVFAWCHLTTEERNGLFFRSPYPTKNDCMRIND